MAKEGFSRIRGAFRSDKHIRIVGGNVAFEKLRGRYSIELRIWPEVRNAMTPLGERADRLRLSLQRGQITLSSRFALTDSSYNSTLGIPESVRVDALNKDAQHKLFGMIEPVAP